MFTFILQLLDNTRESIRDDENHYEQATKEYEQCWSDIPDVLESNAFVPKIKTVPGSFKIK